MLRSIWKTYQKTKLLNYLGNLFTEHCSKYTDHKIMWNHTTMWIKHWWCKLFSIAHNIFLDVATLFVWAISTVLSGFIMIYLCIFHSGLPCLHWGNHMVASMQEKNQTVPSKNKHSKAWKASWLGCSVCLGVKQSLKQQTAKQEFFRKYHAHNMHQHFCALTGKMWIVNEESVLHIPMFIKTISAISSLFAHSCFL